MSQADKIIAGYRLIRLMYQGMTSQVWEVAEPRSGMHFALKILLPEALREQQHRNFLLHEAEVGPKFQHPNVIRIVKLVREKNEPCLVSEHFASVNLGLRIKRREQRGLNPSVDASRTVQHELLVTQARFILEQAANGLAHIHEKGYVHRDVKPDNILVNSVGEVKIVDFALAQRISKGGFFSNWFRKRGPVQGTPSYISPEQMRNEPLDARSDLYSFGISIYHLLVGRLPFVGMSPGDLLNKQLFEKPVPPEVYNPQITDDCSKLVLRMIAKDRRERPTNLNEFLVLLHGIRIFKNEKRVPRKPTKPAAKDGATGASGAGAVKPPADEAE